MRRSHIITLTLGLVCLLSTCAARAQYSGTLQPAFDCNSNGVDDTQDITQGTSQDCNQNNSPDECDILSGTGSGFPSDVRINAATASGGIYANRDSIQQSNGARTFGWAVGGGGDLNDDGVDDFIIGEPFQSRPTRGSAWVVFG